MEINLTTPALLFPALSLLLLAYTNRFLALAALIRSLLNDYKKEPDVKLLQQIHGLRYRVNLIRNMQALGIISIFLCVVAMFLIFIGQVGSAHVVFALSLISLMVSLVYSLREIQLSGNALNVLLRDLEIQTESDEEARTLRRYARER